MESNKIMFKKIIIIALVLLLGACSSAVRMSDADKQSVQNIKINKKVIYPEEMHYVPPSGAFIFGALGAVIAQEANRDPARVLVRLSRDNGVKIEEIVANQFVKQMENIPGFRLDQKPYDAQLNIKIILYGFTAKLASMSEVKPALKVEAQLVSRSNKVLWQNNDFVTALSDLTPAVAVETMGNNPEALERAWVAAAEIVVANILETI